MSNSLQLVGGSTVSCNDECCGTLGRIIIDPASRTATHLAVEPQSLFDATGRLVPIASVQSAGDEVRLACTKAEFDAFDPDEVYETRVTSAVAAPMMRGGVSPITQVILHQIPDGEIEVTREENIQDIDGSAGHLRGLSIDAEDYRITHLLLRVGGFLHKKDVILPVELVTAIDGQQMTLSLTKEQVDNFA